MRAKSRKKLFNRVLEDLADLDQWFKKEGRVNNWSITEKLAFLRNVEAVDRTKEAKFRTWLAVVGSILAGTAFVFALLK